MVNYNQLYNFISARIKKIFHKFNISATPESSIVRSLTKIIIDNCPDVEDREEYIASVLNKLEDMPSDIAVQAVIYRDGEILITYFKRDDVDGSFGNPNIYSIKYSI
ncbi:MAG: hypothetical protein DRO67_08665 [Candidatus Asgardarchaeum californiense]|nr:MAG: hypothetical protein DRO67_08665 [Candidatus Asgardarchaeum californiense]